MKSECECECYKTDMRYERVDVSVYFLHSGPNGDNYHNYQTHDVTAFILLIR